MKNRVAVTIAGQEYTLLAPEEESYVRKVAAYVDAQIQEVTGQGRLSQADAAVLAAVNVGDQYFREQEAAENLRRQLKEELEASARLKNELSECKREIFKLQNRLQNKKP
ncbi:MAG: cell division protein ZapA [Lawsonibacter sp.]|nr:cell division protein ZapA [Lawsonibacter sp.]